MVAELGESAAGDQLYRITFDGSVADEHGYVAMGGQADQVATVLKERYSDGMSLSAALARRARRAGRPGQRRYDPRSTPASWRSRCSCAAGSTGRSGGSPARRLEELLSAARTPPGGKGQAPAAPEPGDAGPGG